MFLGCEPKNRDVQEIAVARWLSERGALLEQQAEAESRLAAIGVAWDAAGEDVEGIRGRAAEWPRLHAYDGFMVPFAVDVR